MYLSYLKLPNLPKAFLPQIRMMASVPEPMDVHKSTKSYRLPDSICEWLRTNVMDADWYIQVFDEDQEIHKDRFTTTRLMYLLDQGGDEVVTAHYDDEHNLISSDVIPVHTWAILKADVFHSVDGIEMGRQRVMITARVFGRHK